MFYSFIHSLPQFNHPLKGVFTWLTPPGPSRATTCRERDLTLDQKHTFFYHTRTMRASPHERSAQCRGHLRDNTNMKDDTHQTRTHSSTRRILKDDYDGQMIFANLVWLKLADICLTGERKPRKKSHAGNLSRSVIEPGPATWQARMLPPAAQRWTHCFINERNIHNSFGRTRTKQLDLCGDEYGVLKYEWRAENVFMEYSWTKTVKEQIRCSLDARSCGIIYEVFPSNASVSGFIEWTPVLKHHREETYSVIQIKYLHL